MKAPSGNAVIGRRTLQIASLVLCGLALTIAWATNSTSRAASTRDGGTIMAGTAYATPYYVIHGDKPGPTAVIMGGLHGDEPAGYLAAEKLLKGKLLAGTLVIVPRAHIAAIRRNARGYPRNMNRLFPGKAKGDAMEQLAYQLWRLTVDSKPSLFLTLHESRGFYRDDPKRYGQTFTFDFPELKPDMKRVMTKLNAGIKTPRDKFSLKVDPFPTCPTYQSYKHLKVPATSIETAKPLPLQTRIRYQLMAVACFLQDAGLQYVPPGAPIPVSRAVAAPPSTPTPTATPTPSPAAVPTEETP